VSGTRTTARDGHHIAAGLLGTGLLLLTPALSAQETTDFVETELRNPFEVRDEHVLAQGRLTLPATTPDTVGRGDTRLRVSYLWGSSFSWTQDIPGETPKDRHFLIDGETRTLDLTVTHGLGDSFDLALRVPMRWRGGGSLDGFIDAWHRTFSFLGVTDGDRPAFRRDAFRVEGITTSRRPFSWDDAAGSGLGNLELAGRWRLRHDRTAIALLGRLSLPTATEPFESSLGAAVQLVARHPLSRNADLLAGAGGTVEGEIEVAGVAYERVRAQGFAAITWRPWRRIAFSFETNVASRLVKDIDRYPGTHWLVNGGLKFALAPKAVLEVGMTENLKNQLSTTDFAVYFAISARP
jgi:hypothetical protein